MKPCVHEESDQQPTTFDMQLSTHCVHTPSFVLCAERESVSGQPNMENAWIKLGEPRTYVCGPVELVLINGSGW